MPEYFNEAAFQNCLCQLNPELALFWGIHCNWSTQVYFYHPDLLASRATTARSAARVAVVMQECGNNEFITDISGYVYGTSRPQRLDQYLYHSPFGEALLDQKANTGAFDSPYRFNEKLG